MKLLLGYNNRYVYVPGILKQRVNAAPDKLFLFSEADKRQFTYREFEAAVMRTANMLAANGVGKATLSLLLPNSVDTSSLTLRAGNWARSPDQSTRCSSRKRLPT